MTAHVGLRHRSAPSCVQEKGNKEETSDQNAAPNLNDSSDDDESGTLSQSSSVHSELNSSRGSSSSVSLKTKKSLEERGAVPPSIIMVSLTILTMQWCAGAPFYLETVLPSTKHTMLEAVEDLKSMAVYFYDLLCDLFSDRWKEHALKEYFVAFVVVAFLKSIIFVLIIAPFREGMWTNRKRIKRHKLHRYFGLVFLIMYALAWTEFSFDYERRAKDSYLPHIISLNGVIQATSAYFSFRVLPDLADPGYYSDKAVLSRLFVHENIFFQLMSVWGAVYYNNNLRQSLQSQPVGKFVEMIFLFFPYVIIRRFFPTTRFSDAGSSKSGRSKSLQKFYDIGTFAVKIFYLWAKYFLNFFINWAVYLNLLQDHHWYSVRGMFLMNVGTISISVFLHTLRFKKVLPGLLTFSFYLLQIYSTFLFIPMAFDLFTAHLKLSLLCFAGLLMNMTRSRKAHALWCVVSCVLINLTNIEW